VVEPLRTRPPRVVRTGSHLAVPSGELAGDLKPLSVNRRRRVAIYELRVANDTSGPLVGFTYVDEPNSGGTVNWSTITVPPHTSVATPIELPLPRRGRAQRVVTELHADGARLTLDAQPPSGNVYAGRAAIALTVALIAGIASTTYVFARPQVDALVAPTQVAAGRPFQVLYALAPSTTNAQFSVTTADGRTIENGTLARERSSFSVSLPRTPRSTGYDVTISGANAFGRTFKKTHVVALAPPPPPPKRPTQSPIALAADTVSGGVPITVTYPRGIDAGGVKLLDQDGTERAAALVSKRGSSILIAPAVTVAQDFRVIVDLQRGSTLSERALALRIVPALNAAKTDAQASDDTAPASNDSSAPQVTSGVPISVGQAPVRSGQPIFVRVLHFAPQMQITLINDRGEELQRLDVARGEDRLPLTAPTVSAPTTMIVLATFAHGVGQDSVVAPVTIRPR
jgi:hypothetical protein